MNFDNRTLFIADNLGFLGSSLKKEDTETLLLELALRGIDVSKLRDDEPITAEIVQIG